MLGAIVRENIVENVIVVEETQVAELAEALGCEIVDARPYGLIAGDLRTDRGWTRNAGGEQMVLEEMEPEAYDSYSVAMRRADAAEASAKQVAEAIAKEAVSEAVAVLKEEVGEKPEAAAISADLASRAVQTSLDVLIARLEAIPAMVAERWK